MHENPPPKTLQELRAEILTGAWIDLQPHAERDAVFYIHPDLDLAEVALKIASDDTTAIAKWIEDQSLNRPTADQMRSWNAAPDKLFCFIIVAPYVVMQEQAH